MKKLLILVGFLPFIVGAQQQQLDLVTGLTTEVHESSSLIYVDDKVFTVNDSGNEAFIYEMDTITGEVARSISIVGATNVDWESITYNTQYVYVGDIGNNAGTRMDLKYYRVHLSDFLTQDEVVGQIILFKYEDQATFFSNEMNTPWDAESTIVSNDTLYLFTKNWTDNVTDVYTIPATPGNHIAHKIATIPTPGLITDATIATTGQVVLTGYDTTGEVFIMKVTKQNGASGIYYSVDEVTYLIVPSDYSKMVEGICTIGPDQFYFSSEKIPFKNGGIFRFGTEDTTGSTSTAGISEENMNSIKLFPNPSTDRVIVEAEGMTAIDVFSVLGNKVLSIDDIKNGQHTIVVDQWTTGVYVAKVNIDGNTITQRFVVK